MSLEEFEESFWMFVSEDLVSNKDIDNNKNWSSHVVHDAWRMYINGNVDHSFIFNAVQNVIHSYKRFNPRFEK